MMTKIVSKNHHFFIDKISIFYMLYYIFFSKYLQVFYDKNFAFFDKFFGPLGPGPFGSFCRIKFVCLCDICLIRFVCLCDILYPFWVKKSNSYRAGFFVFLGSYFRTPSFYFFLFLFPFWSKQTWSHWSLIRVSRFVYDRSCIYFYSYISTPI